MIAPARTGLATSLPRIGITLEEMHEFLTRPETESVHSAYQALKEARAKELSGELKLGSGTAGGALDLSLMFKGVGETPSGKRKRGSVSGLSSISAGVAESDKRSRARSSVGGEEEGRRPGGGPSPLSASALNGGRDPFANPLLSGGGSNGGGPTSGGMMGPAPGYFPMPEYGALNGAATSTDDSMRFTNQQFPPPGMQPFPGQFGPGIPSLPIGSMGAQPSNQVRIPSGLSDQAGDGLPPNAAWPAGTEVPVQPPGQMLDDSDASWDDILKMQASLLENGGKKWEAFQLITYHMEK